MDEEDIRKLICLRSPLDHDVSLVRPERRHFPVHYSKRDPVRDADPWFLRLSDGETAMSSSVPASL